MKKILLLAVPLVLFLGVNQGAFAERYYEQPEPIPGPQGDPGLDGLDATADDNVIQSVAAMSAALSQAHFDHDTLNLQLSIGAGYSEGTQAGALSAAKRVCPSCDSRPLFSASYANSSEGGPVGGLGLTFEIP